MAEARVTQVLFDASTDSTATAEPADSTATAEPAETDGIAAADGGPFGSVFDHVLVVTGDGD